MAKRGRILFRCALFAALMVFLPSVNDFFYRGDDFYWLEKCHDLPREGGVLSLLRPHAGMWYRPWNLVFFRVCYAIAGLRPLTYHLALLVVHAASCGALFLLLQRLGASPRPAGLAALLYAVGKPMGESARWLSCFHDVCGSLFYLLSMIFLLEWRRRGRWWQLVVLIACVVASYMSKEDTISLPATLLILWLWRRPSQRAPDLRRSLLLLALLASTTLVYLVFVKTGSDTSGIGRKGFVELSVDGVTELSYLFGFVMSFMECTLFIPSALPCLALVFCLLCWQLLSRRDSRALCALWTLCAALPISVVLNWIAAVVARHSHIPYLGYAALVAIGLVACLDRWLEGRLSVLQILMLGLVMEVVIVGYDPLRPLTFDVKMCAVPMLVGVWLAFFVALRRRWQGSPRWIALVAAISLFKLLALAFTNMPWWVGCFGSWGLTTGVVAMQSRPSRSELVSAGLLCALAFGPVGGGWAGSLLFSLLLGGLMLVPRHIRKWAYAAVLVSAVAAPMYRRSRETGKWEQAAKKYENLITSLGDKLPDLRPGDTVVWVSASGNEPVGMFTPSSLIRCTQGFPNIRVETASPDAPSLPRDAVIVRYSSYDAVEVDRIDRR